ncbi:CaiB/BaiF CoA transferase family protein [Azospirillum sp.]|uniref:CaiB/BaiF CoA transferase family protein n=1 Tax=Azospirillum sp. TaxID=34012 RepID=UPI003D7162CB
MAASSTPQERAGTGPDGGRPIASDALANLRVLDLTRVRAGPTCCRVLADFGADVIKVEAPAGADPNDGMNGPRDGYDMQNLHRNKRSLSLNLKTPEGKAVLRRLVSTADVVVENYRPDVKHRLGMDYETLRAINPRIILASISGFGQSGPYRDRGGFDQIAQGMGGLMWLTGLPGQGPVRAGVAIADISSGLYAVIGILIALAERARSGEGQWVQTSLLQSQIALLDFQAARYLMDGVVAEQAGNDHPTSTPMGLYRTADGFINIGASGEDLWRRLCRAVGQPALAERPEYRTEPDRLANRPRLNAELGAILAERPSRDWLDVFTAQGVPAGPVYRMDEVFADPQVEHLGMAVPVQHPRRGAIRLVGQPVVLSRTPAGVVSPTPEAGAHTDGILGDLGYTPQEIDDLRRQRVI